MPVKKGIRLRLYPNKEQSILLNKTLGCCRFLYNKMLEEHIRVYDKLKDDKDALYSHKYKTAKQYKQEYPFLKEVDAKALQTENRHLFAAYQNFFEGLITGRGVGFPRFKSKKCYPQTYTTYNINNSIRIYPQRRKIRIPKVGWIKYRDNRQITEQIKHITLSRTVTHKYFASVTVMSEVEIPPKKTVLNSEDIAGFDMSATHFLIGEQAQYENPRFYREEEKRIKRRHRELSRKKERSKNWEKSRLKLGRTYEKINNRKLDWLHKTTHDLSERYDAVILENLNIKGMQQFNSGLSKSITLDFSWYQFRRYLYYKMSWQGKHFVLINRFFPSSKLCSICGQINNDLKLSDRVWTCKSCDTTNHRDSNAMVNIKREGIRILQEEIGIVVHHHHDASTVGTTERHASGEDVRPYTDTGQFSWKEESTCL
ncbi:MAG: RNA-guided endonuclease InsQ/TnpB family protein [Planctomycetota bacterium]|jgi:putative transposase